MAPGQPSASHARKRPTASGAASAAATPNATKPIRLASASSAAIILLFPISTVMLIHKSQRGKYAACDRSPRSGQIFRRSPRRRRRVAGGARRDRKSVGGGKSVSVRVDFGGGGN